MPQGESSVLANAEHLLSHFGGAVALLRRLTPPGAGQASSWHVLATLQLLHVAARPLLRAQTEAAFRGEAPSAVLRKHLEPLLEVRRRSVFSKRWPSCNLIVAPPAVACGSACRSQRNKRVTKSPAVACGHLSRSARHAAACGAQKLNHGLKSSRNTAGLALDDVAQSMRARMLCDTLLPLYSEAGEVLRATARAHETVDMCED